METEHFVLIATSQVVSSYTFSFPFSWWRTKAFVIKAWWINIDSYDRKKGCYKSCFNYISDYKFKFIGVPKKKNLSLFTCIKNSHNDVTFDRFTSSVFRLNKSKKIPWSCRVKLPLSVLKHRYNSFFTCTETNEKSNQLTTWR